MGECLRESEEGFEALKGPHVLSTAHNVVIDETLERYRNTWPQPTIHSLIKGLVHNTRLSETEVEAALLERGMSLVESVSAQRRPTRRLSPSDTTRLIEKVMEGPDLSGEPLPLTSDPWKTY